MMIRFTMLATLALASTACGPAPSSTSPSPPVPVVPASTTDSVAARFFPLMDGHIYQYEIESGADVGVMMTRVTRSDGAGGDLQGPRGTKTFQYASDGITLMGEGTLPIYVLKTPLSVGNKWRGRGGSWVEIAEVDAAVSVPAGEYAGCIKTLEQRGGDNPLRIATTYCPDIGIVLLEAASGAEMERVALKSYGPPVDLGPDGVRAIPPDDPAPSPQ